MKEDKQNFKPVVVYSNFVQSQLLLAKMALDREGIRYETTNENIAALYPGADGMATIDLVVDESDMERAKEALKSAGLHGNNESH